MYKTQEYVSSRAYDMFIISYFIFVDIIEN